jgi:hypothetical protein
MRILLAALCAGLSLCAQTKTVFENLPALDFANDKLSLTMIPEGGAFAQLLLRDDAGKISPLWNPMRFAREAGQPQPKGGFHGHFVCVDGFGQVSSEETAAGFPMHGEAQSRPWQMLASNKNGKTLSATFEARLVLSQEVFTRTIHIVDGENIVWVESDLENLLPFDRPARWAEHATIGSPFLEAGKTVVDMPAERSRTRGYPKEPDGYRLIANRDFTWPMAPAKTGGTIDLRAAPLQAGTGGHTASLLNRSRRLVFVTALHPGKHLLVGWVFRREDYPWVQNWESFPNNNALARGLEFGTQPFDLPTRETLQMSPVFDTPTYRILPAKSKLRTSFLMFYAQTPDGMEKIDDVRLEGGKLIVEDRKAGKTITLPASRSLQ